MFFLVVLIGIISFIISIAVVEDVVIFTVPYESLRCFIILCSMINQNIFKKERKCYPYVWASNNMSTMSKVKSDNIVCLSDTAPSCRNAQTSIDIKVGLPDTLHACKNYVQASIEAKVDLPDRVPPFRNYGQAIIVTKVGLPDTAPPCRN